MSFTTRHALESSSTSSYSPPQCRQFTFSEIELATQNFDESLVIGRGGFGKVYRGTITYDGIDLDAAIKRLESGSSQGAAEFWTEIEMLSNLRHCHLVSLIGYCNDGQEMILVYEYMPKGTLADRLHKRHAPLTWVRRLKICIGAARGLDYLHNDTGTKPRVIHRDVKSTKILLDDDWEAKVSDFGLSKIGPTNQPSTYVNTLVRGTFGYLDPDYFQTGRLTRKSDVYAFGVVLFEVLCGKQAVDRSIDEEHWGLATWAQDSIKEGRLKKIVDSNFRGTISPKCLKKFARIAGRCLHNRPKKRPTMAEVVLVLESILASQEKTDSALLIKLFGRIVPTSIFPDYPENSVADIYLKCLDKYLYTVVGKDPIVNRFDFNIIVDATENFSVANKLVLSRYNSMFQDTLDVPYFSMYKGRLQNGQDITIAQFSDAITYKECMNEATVLVKLEHENVIQLLGYCIDETKTYLLYDFAPYATLDGLIFDPVYNLLDWNDRYKIILCVAKVLLYLHKHAPLRIIHGDVRPANILLDESFNPKLSGFGLATVVNDIDCVLVDQLRGTVGYMAPEYIRSTCLSTKADVFGFGTLVLETVTGQRASALTHITDGSPGDAVIFFNNVYINWLGGTLSDIIGPRFDVDSILLKKVIVIGLWCVQEAATLRPTMEEVVDMLLGTSSLTLPELEMQPMTTDESTLRSRLWVINDLTEYDSDADTGEVEDFISELCPR